MWPPVQAHLTHPTDLSYPTHLSDPTYPTYLPYPIHLPPICHSRCAFTVGHSASMML